MRKDRGREDQKTIVYDDAVDDNEVGNLKKIYFIYVMD